MRFLSLEKPTWVLADGFQFALRESTLSGTIICLILFVLSCFSWAVMISKLRMVRRAARESREFLALFRRGRSPFQLYEEGHRFPWSPLFAVYQAGCREATFHLMGSSEVDETFRARLQRADRLTPAEMDGVRNAMDRASGEMMLKLEAQMSLLATAVSGAPFLGLLGTVWGVMDTFGGVALAEGAASLKSMAPGVSAALVTTVIGLLVAIPAMFGYNFLVNSIKNLLIQLENYAAELGGSIERRHADLRGPGTNPAPRFESPPAWEESEVEPREGRGERPTLASMGAARAIPDEPPAGAVETGPAASEPAPTRRRPPPRSAAPAGTARTPQSELDFSAAPESG